MIDERKIGTKNPLGQRPVPSKNSRDPASDRLVADILAYFAARPDDMMRFFELTGLTPQSLRRAAAQPGFPASLLDYLCSDHRLLLAFATESGHDPAEIDARRQAFVVSNRDAL